MKKHFYGWLAVVFVCFILLSLILAVQTQAATTWTVESAAMTWTFEMVDGGGGIGASLKLDSNGNPHISYYGNGLNYAEWNGSTWNIEIVDSDTFASYLTSLALDSDGRPHISYIAYGRLKFAEWTDSTWNIESVPSEGNAHYNSLALDSDGNPHISYYADNFNCLMYAKRIGSTWNIETVDSPGGTDNSIALDPNGYPHISYRTGARVYHIGTLKYARWNGAAWNIETVDWDKGACSSIVLDSDKHPHISYYNQSSLKYAVWTGSGWHNEIIDENIMFGGDFDPYYFYCSLVLDSNGNPHISYNYNPPDNWVGNLKYAAWNGSAWSTETVASTVLDNSIAVDSSGHPHISYYGSTNGGMKLNYASGVKKIPSRVSVSTSSSSTFAGFRVNVTGTLRDVYGNGLKNQTVLLSYSFSGINTWTPITSCTTDSAGNYWATWIPTATGSFTLNASWSGTSAVSAASSTTMLTCLSYDEYVFSVESNSTISGLAFNANNRVLSFTANGADGTNGYARATVAKNFTANPAGIKVSIDGTQVACSPTSTSDSYLIYFTYQHSTHSVAIDLSAAAQPTPTPTSSPTATTTPTPTLTSSPSPTPAPSATLPSEIIYALAAVTIAAIVATAVVLIKKQKK